MGNYIERAKSYVAVMLYRIFFFNLIFDVKTYMVILFVYFFKIDELTQVKF